ncbi:MAG: chemotaxis protein CheW [Acidimicrobiales bacterium]
MTITDEPTAVDPTSHDPLGDPRTLLVATFRLAGLRFGIDAGDVREALQGQPLTVVPHAPAEISGLMNLRGEVVVALDLRTRLHLPMSAEPDSSRPPLMNLVVTVGSEPVSLLVDEIDDVIAFDAGDIERVPDTVDPHLTSFLAGVHQQPDGLLLILDLARVVDTIR